MLVTLKRFYYHPYNGAMHGDNLQDYLDNRDILTVLINRNGHTVSSWIRTSNCNENSTCGNCHVKFYLKVESYGLSGSRIGLYYGTSTFKRSRPKCFLYGGREYNVSILNNFICARVRAFL